MTTDPVSWIVSLSATTVLPSPDPLGYPVPPWILQVLAYLMLTVHFTAIHFTLGGTLLFFWLRLRRKPGHDEVTRFFRSGLPLGVSYIITFGIPPLLFLQVLYGQMFYSSSVLIGTFWILVIPLTMLAYGGFYFHKFGSRRRKSVQVGVLVVCFLMLMTVGYIFVNNLTLVMTPAKWMGLYQESPAGVMLHHGEPTVAPRYLLFLAGALAVAGLSLIWRGAFLKRWNCSDEAAWAPSLGFRAVLLTLILWIVAGIGVYLARPEEVKGLISSGVEVWMALSVGVICAIVAVLMAYVAIGSSKLIYPMISSVAIFLVTGCMVLLRDIVRIRELSPHWDMSAVPVAAQWGMFVLFLVISVLGFGFLTAMAIMVLPKLATGERGRPEHIADAGT